MENCLQKGSAGLHHILAHFLALFGACWLRVALPQIKTGQLPSKSVLKSQSLISYAISIWLFPRGHTAQGIVYARTEWDAGKNGQNKLAQRKGPNHSRLPRPEQSMSDHSISSVRNSILYLLSLPKQFVAQQFGLEELGPVADGLAEIADALRSRYIVPTASPLKSFGSHENFRNLKYRIDECLSLVRRYTTLVSCQSNLVNDGTTEASIAGRFKLIHQQHQANSDSYPAYTTLSLEVEDRYGQDENSSRTVTLKIVQDCDTIPLWTLALRSDSMQGAFTTYDPDASEVNLHAIKELHSQASGHERNWRVFILAVSSLFVEIIQNSQGIQLYDSLFEDHLSTLFDSVDPVALISAIDFPLPNPPERKRTAQSMDESTEMLLPEPKKPLLA